MLEWTDQPPATENQFNYRLIRVPAAKPLRCIILSDKMSGTYTHYAKGRTTPCDRESCLACKDGLPYRWHSYLAIHNADTGENALLELTATAAAQLQPAIAEFKTLRAVKIILERPSRRPNGRIKIAIVPGRAPEAGLPEAPNVPAIMQHIWGLDDRQLQPATPRRFSDHFLPTPKSNGETEVSPSART
jgi:hypothetical protein